MSCIIRDYERNAMNYNPITNLWYITYAGATLGILAWWLIPRLIQ